MEKQQVEKEVGKVEDAIAVIQNEHQYLQLRLDNLKKENRIVDENIVLFK